MKALKILFIFMLSICVSLALVSCDKDDLENLAENLLNNEKDDNGDNGKTEGEDENGDEKPNPEDCEHEDENRDRICDICAAIYVAPCTEHTDENSDLMCDYCAERLSPEDGIIEIMPEQNKPALPPAENNGNNDIIFDDKCDHKDSDLNYFCDICDMNVCDHHDTEGDLICDGCGIALDNEADDSIDNEIGLPSIDAPTFDYPIVDIPDINYGDNGMTVIIHLFTDADGDNLCDKCGVDIKSHSQSNTLHAYSDANKDGLCDTCKKSENEHKFVFQPSVLDHEFMDENGDKLCDKCGATHFSDTIISTRCFYFIDKNGDKLCDNCGIHADSHLKSPELGDNAESESPGYPGADGGAGAVPGGEAEIPPIAIEPDGDIPEDNYGDTVTTAPEADANANAGANADANADANAGADTAPDYKIDIEISNSADIDLPLDKSEKDLIYESVNTATDYKVSLQ